jgi:hypothetical protein
VRGTVNQSTGAAFDGKRDDAGTLALCYEQVRRAAKPPTVTIRFSASGDREIAFGYGLMEFDAK